MAWVSAVADRDLYLCCNMWFDRNGAASDANYMYLGGRFLPVGTSVRLIGASRRSVTFVTAKAKVTDTPYQLSFDYGTDRMNDESYFRLIFRESSPLETITSDRHSARPFIESGKLAVNMTRSEAIMARGYPPFHTTPGIDADEWLYYQSRGSVRYVRFRDGVISSIEDGMPP
jgi:hypothetical protein